MVNYRPGYSHAWANKEHYSRLRLNPLTAAGAEELLDALMGAHGDLATVKQLLISRTDGNPFFVEESVRSLTASGVLIGAKGNYRPGVQVENIRIPNTVQTVLADRVDRLPALEKQLLQSAAVIGMIVPERLLHGITGLPEEELRGALSHLQTGEFLYESNLYPKLEYKFTHALINEVVYGALLHERKTALACADCGGDRAAKRRQSARRDRSARGPRVSRRVMGKSRRLYEPSGRQSDEPFGFRRGL